MNDNRVNDNIYAGKMLTVMASQVVGELLIFSSWMIAGFGALLGVMIANVESIAKFISPQAFGNAIVLFLVAVVLHVLQRYLASIVIASVAVGREIESLPISEGADLEYILGQLEKASLWPARIMVRWSNRKVMSGDLAIGGRTNSVMAQIQAWLVFAQLILVLRSAYVIASSLQW